MSSLEIFVFFIVPGGIAVVSALAVWDHFRLQKKLRAHVARLAQIRAGGLVGEFSTQFTYEQPATSVALTGLSSISTP